MKKTQRKDLLRNIRKQWVSFLSIIIIAMLGITTFLGIDYTSYSLRQNGSEYYNSQNFRDIEVVSTLLFTEDDLQALRDLKGVATAEPVYQVSAAASSETAHGDAMVVSLTESVNQPSVSEGRLPAGAWECAVEQLLADAMKLQVGSTLELTGADTQTAKYLKAGAYTVVGIVTHPDHTNNIVQETPYVLATVDAFDKEALNNCFMRAEIIVEKDENADRFSAEYEALVATVLEEIDELSATRTTLRDLEIQTGARDRIGAAKQQLEDGFARLEDAKATIRNTLRNLVESVFRQSDEHPLVHWAEVQMPDADNPNATARYLWITENLRLDVSRSPKDIFLSILSSNGISERFLVSIYQFIQNEDAPTTADGSYNMPAIREALATRATEYVKDFQALSDGCVAWDEGHESYLAALETYRKTMAELQPCRWISFDGRGNASFAQLIVGSQNFSNLKTTFSLLFVFVGALVIFATVGKIVDEQRSLVGTTKALGFFSREIFAKYLSFGILATVTGTLLGMLAARFLIAPFLLEGFNKYYFFDISGAGWHALPTLFALIFGILLATAAVWFACNRLLREPAVRLMQPKAPGVKKGCGRKGKHVLSLYSRLILLNMRTDLKRVVVTIVSVMGCCALIVIGFTLRSSVSGAVEKQYGGIIDYDVNVKYDPEVALEDGNQFRQVLEAEGTTYASVYSASVTYRLPDLQIAELYCGEIAEINEFYHLNDWQTGAPIAPTDRGVLIQRRIAESCGLGVGSEFEIAIGGTNTATVRVAGIYENYIGRSIVMSRTYYEKAFGIPFGTNTFLVRLNGADAEKLEGAMRGLDGYRLTERSDVNRSIIETSTSMLDTVVLLFIGIAAVMAGIVQMNLTNMYVLQKKRELTIMRINGFTVKETVGYLLRETVLTTVLGIVLGIGAGAGLAYSIVRTLEQSFLKLDRSVDMLAWLYAAAMTVLFTVIVNAIALRKVRNLKLTDAA